MGATILNMKMVAVNLQVVLQATSLTSEKLIETVAGHPVEDIVVDYLPDRSTVNMTPVVNLNETSQSRLLNINVHLVAAHRTGRSIDGIEARTTSIPGVNMIHRSVVGMMMTIGGVETGSHGGVTEIIISEQRTLTRLSYNT